MKINTILQKAIQQSIKPCPCCGSKDVYFKIIDKVTGSDLSKKEVVEKLDIFEKVGCFTCGLNMTRVEGCNIVNQWNNRI